MKNAFNFALALVLAAGLALPASTAPAAPEDHDLPALRGDKTFNVSKGRGHWLALHFVPGSLSSDAIRARDFAARAPELAGARHLFILPGAGEFDPAFSRLSSWRDLDSKLAAEYRLSEDGAPPAAWTLVVLDKQGAESFRLANPTFETFGPRFERATGQAALDEYNLGSGNLALNGYDPVSYVDESQAAEGDAGISSRWRGVNYRFANAENRQRFANNPEKYVPTYGGWCATAMAEGDKVDIDPTNFKVTNGRLFVFYYGWLGDAKKSWNKDEPNLTRQADQQWRQIAGE